MSSGSGKSEKLNSPMKTLNRPPCAAACEKALDVALKRVARAYEGLMPPAQPGETFEDRVRAHSRKFTGRGEPGASEIVANLFDAASST